MTTQSRSQRELDELLTKRERKLLDGLTSPSKIQAYLDATRYSTDPIYRAPLTVMRDRRAHCFDGACFAAMALERIGHPPRLLDMLPWDDDDHVLALYKRGSRFGCLAKSNFTGLRGREPVYRSLRELLMSYFEPFFNMAKNRTLRGYTRPLALGRYDRSGWTHRDKTMDLIAKGLDDSAKVRLFTPSEVRAFTKVDDLTVRSNLWAADPAGLRKPKNG
ncbi:MAG: hypothetical protein JWN04_3313 [Myxococcaceae bacterium]|nr:hypothetical protein [Myxococcaceae bacterium]